MFGNRRTLPPPPERTVWADATKQKLDAIAKERNEIVSRLDAEEMRAKLLCNHTYPSGKSAMKPGYDSGDPYGPDGRGDYERCEICKFST